MAGVMDETGKSKNRSRRVSYLMSGDSATANTTISTELRAGTQDMSCRQDVKDADSIQRQAGFVKEYALAAIYCHCHGPA